ncbi:MAG: MFS transporter, partial [Desulfobacca sp.]|nr:MFS transporter [Desulfobacca sp.]
MPISPPQKSYVSRAILILTGLNLLDYLDRYVIAALATPIKLELGLSDRAFGLLGTAFFLVYLMSSPVFGYLGDRWGRIRLMATGAVLWSLATSLAAWVSTYSGLLVARGLVGLGEASFGTLAPAYLADVLPITRRARYLGLFYATIPVGAALAYYFGGQVGHCWGWRWAFLLAGLPGLGLGLLVFTLPKQSTPGAPVSESSQTGGVGQPLLVAAELWKIPTFRRVTLGYGLLTFALGGLAFWMPRFLELH